jgi:hypothetical protein
MGQKKPNYIRPAPILKLSSIQSHGSNWEGIEELIQNRIGVFPFLLIPLVETSHATVFSPEATGALTGEFRPATSRPSPHRRWLQVRCDVWY